MFSKLLSIKPPPHLIMVTMLVSCVNPSSDDQVKFEKKAWMTKRDIGPCECRLEMIDDLTQNYKLTGLNRIELIELLGPPDLEYNTRVSYDLVVDYGSDIDPVYVKTLVFDLNSQSIVKSFKIVEWKK